MTKGQTTAVIGKRVQGSKIVYQLQIGTEVQWVEYEQMIDHLDLVINYEKQRKAKLSKLISQIPSVQQETNVQIQQEDEAEVDQSRETVPRREIKEILFIEQKKSLLHFKVRFTDGSFRLMNNTQLRSEYPEKLLDFYESNLQVEFD